MIDLVLPEKIFAPLFEDVALSGLMHDGKLWADALPRFEPELILSKYEEQKRNNDFDLWAFVNTNFIILDNAVSDFKTNINHDASLHIHTLWPYLLRNPDQRIKGSSLIALPFKYIVPGGRFNEIYYWDSYFTMLGLQISGQEDVIESMVHNFAWMISEIGFIPNGNRSYFLSRSQPPFFSLMLDLLADVKGDEVYLQFEAALKAEYNYWMLGSDVVNLYENTKHHSVYVAPECVISRYWDQLASPRSEMFKDDIILAKTLIARSENSLYCDLRAACESGWDFSSRWCNDPYNLSTIETSQIIPVDLNCLLYHMESRLAHICKLKNDATNQSYFLKKSENRKASINTYCWNEVQGYYVDYHFGSGHQKTNLTAATLFPLYFGIASMQQAEKTLQAVSKELLASGGLLTTTIESGQQWDAPNGWAPLQWIAVIAAYRYHHVPLALEIAHRWIHVNDIVFQKTGKMMEKYNVSNPNLESGGGEYPVQDGFGWTNGVYLALKKWLTKMETS